MQRSAKLSLKFNTESKKQQIRHLLQEYRRVVNCYVKLMWDRSSSNLQDYKLVTNTRLSTRYRQAAFRQAQSIIITTKKSAKVLRKYVSIPEFNGAMLLNDHLLSPLNSSISFDMLFKLSTLRSGSPLHLVSKKTKVVNKWLKKGFKIKGGGLLSEDSLIIWLEGTPVKRGKRRRKSKDLAIDLGMNKLIVTSDCKVIGTDLGNYLTRVKISPSGSKGKRRAMRSRTDYMNKCVKQLPWSKLHTLYIEDLKNLKQGKSKKRGKSFRKALAPWTYCQVIARIKELAEENCVRLCLVPPAYTSQQCPKCKHTEPGNRSNEVFKCLECGYTADADYVGALNILDRGRSIKQEPMVSVA